jgi:hypothetical protein
MPSFFWVCFVVAECEILYDVICFFTVLEILPAIYTCWVGPWLCLAWTSPWLSSQHSNARTCIYLFRLGHGYAWHERVLIHQKNPTFIKLCVVFIFLTKTQWRQFNIIWSKIYLINLSHKCEGGRHYYIQKKQPLIVNVTECDNYLFHSKSTCW